MDYKNLIGTKEKPLILKTPPLSSEYIFQLFYCILANKFNIKI